MDRETKLDIIEIGRGYLGMILLAVLMYTGAVSAMYAGENMTFEINITNPVYTVVGNSSNLSGLDIFYDNGNITITTVQNFKPDNFTLVFFDNSTREVEKIIHTKGKRSTRTKYVDRDVKVYVPEYVDRNIETEVEVEKIKTNTEYKDQPINYYYILFALVLGGVLTWALSRLFGDEGEYEEEKYDYDEE